VSQENVDVVRATFEAWNSGDMESLRELYDSDAIMRMAEGWPERGPFVGREAVMRQFRQMRETWDADAVEVMSIADTADRVVARVAWRVAGRGPDAVLDATSISTVRKGKIFETEFFWDHAEALKAVGLEE
jgi:ketosteroid isomerase-like protein